MPMATVRRFPSTLTPTSLNVSLVFGFKGFRAGVEQLSFGDDNNVEARSELVLSKNLSNQSLSSISPDRSAQSPRRRNSETATSEIIRQHENRGVAAL